MGTTIRRAMRALCAFALVTPRHARGTDKQNSFNARETWPSRQPSYRRTPARPALVAISCAISLLLVGEQPASAVAPTGHSAPKHRYERGVNVYSLFASREQSRDAVDIGEPQSSYDYLAQRGMTIIRLPIPWERIQPIARTGSGPLTIGQLTSALDGPVDESYLDRVAAEVDKIHTAGMKAVIGLHSGCRFPYRQKPGSNDSALFCGGEISADRISRVWTAISTVFKNRRGVFAYDILNEPIVTSFPGGLVTYRTVTQSLVHAIRATGDTHTVWIQFPEDRANRVSTMTSGPWIHDPLLKVTYSQHFYPGHTALENERYTPTVDAPTITAVSGFAAWCARWTVRCSIGELGWPRAASQPDWPDSTNSWNRLGEKIYSLADHAGMDVTYFAAQSSYGEHLVAYDNTQNTNRRHPRLWPLPGINRAHSQSTVIESHLSQ